MENEMIERVAGAIRERLIHNFPDVEHLLSESAEHEIARAAIEAMREPTEAMANDKVVPFIGVQWGGGMLPEGARTLWRAMIDASLK